MTRTKARTKIWEIKVHLHQTVHQIQIVESRETSELTRTKALTMILGNQSSFTPKGPSTPSIRT